MGQPKSGLIGKMVRLSGWSHSKVPLYYTLLPFHYFSLDTPFFHPGCPWRHRLVCVSSTPVCLDGTERRYPWQLFVACESVPQIITAFSAWRSCINTQDAFNMDNKTLFAQFWLHLTLSFATFDFVTCHKKGYPCDHHALGPIANGLFILQ